MQKNTYELDCTARVLPYTVSSTRPPAYRLEAVLAREIDPALLNRAVRELAPRFPVIYSRLQGGFIWKSLAGASDIDIVRKDGGLPCRPFDLKEKEKPLLRIFYKGNGLAVESSHLTADGAGIITYLSSLIARYLELQGREIEDSPYVLRCGDAPKEAELEDYLPVVCEKDLKNMKRPVGMPAFQCLSDWREDFRRVTRVFIPIDNMKAVLKEKYGGCTISEYLTAVYASAFLQFFEKSPDKTRPVRLSMPVNLRNYWPTETLRNFFCSVDIKPVPDKAGYDFTDVLETVRREMAEKITKEKMRTFFSGSVSYLKLLNYVPGFVKTLMNRAGEPLAKKVYLYTGVISNMGYIQLPPALAEHVKSYAIVMAGFDLARNPCAAVSVNNCLSVVFTSLSESPAISDFCIDFFRKDGLL